MVRLTDRRWSVATSLLVLLTVAGLAAYLYSGWHQHQRLSSAPCAFSSFEHGSWDGVSPVPLVAPATEWLWLHGSTEPGSVEPGSLFTTPARAPPTCA
jgi:hypothetical protein